MTDAEMKERLTKAVGDVVYSIRARINTSEPDIARLVDLLVELLDGKEDRQWRCGPRPYDHPLPVPDQLSAGLKEFFAARARFDPMARPPEVSPECQHGENALLYVSTAMLIRMQNDRHEMECRICGVKWEE